jgi:hypothetical protein
MQDGLKLSTELLWHGCFHSRLVEPANPKLFRSFSPIPNDDQGGDTQQGGAEEPPEDRDSFLTLGGHGWLAGHRGAA